MYVRPDWGLIYAGGGGGGVGGGGGGAKEQTGAGQQILFPLQSLQSELHLPGSGSWSFNIASGIGTVSAARKPVSWRRPWLEIRPQD